MLWRMVAMLGCLLLVLWTSAAAVQADLVVFKVPTTNLKFILQGKSLISRTLPTINFTHTSKQTFDLPQSADTEVIVMPPLNQIASKRLLKAKGNEAGLRQTAVWALDHGLILEFHRAVDQLAASSSADPLVVETKRLKADLAKPLPDETPEDIKSVSAAGYKTVKSAHFLLGCPENDKPADKTEVKKKKPDARLEQLEQLLEIFVMKCAERGLPVQVPTARLKVMLSPAAPPPAAVAGARTNPVDSRVLWASGANTLYISNTNSPIAALDSLRKLQANIQKVYNAPRKRNTGGQPGGVPGGRPGGAPADGGGRGGSSGLDLSALSLGNLSKLTVTTQALMAIGVENFELEAVSREAAYMFTANCGVVPAQAPPWVRDGLAAYFEFPAEMGWLKFGDLGHLRNAWYQASLQDADRFTITDIVTGRCHDNPVSPSESMRAGNMSWALMHFLLQTNPAGLARYLSSFRSIPPDLVLDPDLLNSLFDQAFSEERSKLEESWREYMASWKADYLVLQEEEGGGVTTSEN